MTSRSLENIQSKLNEIASRVNGLDKLNVKVGWFESAKYDDDTPVAYVALIQEFGAPAASIPARSFIRPTIDEQKSNWANQLSRGAKSVINGKIGAEDMLNAIGSLASGQIQQKISSIDSPALSPITLVLRKWRKDGKKITGKTVGEAAEALNHGPVDLSGITSQPLNETGHMISTLTWLVSEK